MTRKKKTRTGKGQVVYLDVPRRSEKLADPDSYESRKKRNLEQKKKHKSVYQKTVEAEKQGGSEETQRKTRLADKIRKLKAQEAKRKEQEENKGEE